MLLHHHLFDYIVDIASTLISKSTTRTTLKKDIVCAVIYLMYILVLAWTRSTSSSIILSLKFTRHLSIQLFLNTPQFFLSLRHTSSLSCDLCQNWLRLLLLLLLLLLILFLLLLGRLSYVYLFHLWANDRLFKLSLLLIIFALFLLLSHHSLSINTSLS